MADVYESYTTVTRADALEHDADTQRIARHFQRYLLPVLQREGCQIAAARVFEFGAGWGRNLLALRSLGARDLAGCDISQEQVALAHRLGMNEIVLMSPDDPPASLCKGKRFDLILAIDVLEHLSLRRIEAFAADMQDLISPNGLLVVQVPNDLAPLNPVRCGDLTHIRAFTVASLRQFFLLTNMQVASIRAVPFPGDGAMHTLRDLVSSKLVAPVVRLLSSVLYGHSEEQFNGPNLLAVGRQRVPLQS